MRISDFFVFAFIVGTVMTIVLGYTYGTCNDVELLPKVFRHLDSTYLERDFMVDTSVGFGARYYHVRLLALLGSVCPLPAVFFLLTILSNVFIAFVTCLAARSFFRGRDLAALIATSLVMAVNGFRLGGECALRLWYLNPHTQALPFALIGLWAGLSLRPFVALIVSCLAALLHPLVGLELGAIAIATAGVGSLPGLSGNGAFDMRKTLIALGRAASAGVILIAFAYLAWIRPRGAPTLDSKDFVHTYAYCGAPFHFVPSSFGKRNYLHAFCFLLASGMSWKWWYDEKPEDRALARRFLIPVGATLLLCVGGFVFVELYPSRMWTTAQTFRLLIIPKWLGYLVIGRTIANSLTSSQSLVRPLVAWVILIGTGVIQSYTLLLGHMLELLRGRFEKTASVRAIGLALGIILLFVGALLSLCGDGRESIILFVAAALSMWFSLCRAGWYRSVIPLGLLALLALTLAVCRGRYIPIVSTYLSHIQPSLTLSELDLSNMPAIDGDQDGLLMARWARHNTPKDALFLTPPWFGMFRLQARRAIVVCQKAAVNQDLREWHDRLDACYGLGPYEDITPARLRFIAEEYGATHAVLRRHTPCGFRVLHQNKTYKLVEIARPAK